MIPVFKIITHAIQLITIVACIHYLLKRQTFQSYRYFSTGWMIVLLFDLTMVIIGLFHPVTNLRLYNITLPVQQVFIMWFFILLLQERKLIIAPVLFTVFAVTNLTIWQGEIILNTYSLALGGILILVLAFIKLFQLYQQDTTKSLFQEAAFWICAGFIVYWGLATPFFAMYNFLWQTFPRFFTYYFFTINFGFTIFLNISVIKALQCSINTAK